MRRAPSSMRHPTCPGTRSVACSGPAALAARDLPPQAGAAQGARVAVKVLLTTEGAHGAEPCCAFNIEGEPDGFSSARICVHRHDVVCQADIAKDGRPYSSWPILLGSETSLIPGTRAAARRGRGCAACGGQAWPGRSRPRPRRGHPAPRHQARQRVLSNAYSAGRPHRLRHLIRGGRRHRAHHHIDVAGGRWGQQPVGGDVGAVVASRDVRRRSAAGCAVGRVLTGQRRSGRCWRAARRSRCPAAPHIAGCAGS